MVMFEERARTPFTRPVVLTLALRLRLLRHVDCLVMSSLVPSLNVPVAVNCTVYPTRSGIGPVGVTAMDDSVAVVAVRVVEPDLPP